MKRSRYTISYHFKKLEKDGFIEIAQKSISIYPNLFRVTRKGKRFVNYQLPLKVNVLEKLIWRKLE